MAKNCVNLSRLVEKNIYPRGYNIEDRNNNKIPSCRIYQMLSFFKSNAIYLCRLYCLIEAGKNVSVTDS